MKFRMNLNFECFVLGMIVMSVYDGTTTPWVLLFAPLMFIDFPGPRFTYRTGEGWKFRWWVKP